MRTPEQRRADRALRMQDPEYRAAEQERRRQRYERIKADPVRLSRQRACQAAYARARRQRDPDALRRHQRTWRARVLSDPTLEPAYRQKAREGARRAIDYSLPILLFGGMR